MKIKRILLFVTMLVLMIAAANAADVSNDTVYDDTSDAIEQVDQSTCIDGQNDEIKTYEQRDDATDKVAVKEDKNLKTSDLILEYTAPNYEYYHHYLSTNPYNGTNVVITILGNITLGGHTEADSRIKNLKICSELTVDKPTFTVNGDNKYTLVKVGNGINLTVENLVITNCANGTAIRSGFTNTYINNVTIKNSQGAINAMGNITVKDSHFINNTGESGAAICTDTYINGSWGTFAQLKVTDSTFSNHTTSGDGAAIYSYGPCEITNSIFENNLAYGDLQTHGGAVYTGANVMKVTNCSFINNTASNGGALFFWGFDEFRVENSTFSYNIANGHGTRNDTNDHDWGVGGAIRGDGYDDTYIGNYFTKNEALYNETIDIYNGNASLINNTYNDTEISLNNINLSIKNYKANITYGSDVTFIFNVTMQHPNYYDSDIFNRTPKKLYINNEEYLVYGNEFTISNLTAGEYNVNFTWAMNTSNTISFNITANATLSIDKTSYDYYSVIDENITLHISDPSGQRGSIKVYVKEGDEYVLRLDSSSYADGDNITTKLLYQMLNEGYSTINPSYEMQLEYESDSIYVNKSQPVRFTFNPIIKRNTTIKTEVLNDIEGNFTLNVTLLDAINNTAIDDAQIKISGDITATITSGEITDTSLTIGNHSITLSFDETNNYNPTTKTLNFTVYTQSQLTIDKDNYDYYAGIDENITLNIDSTEESGDLKVYVKEGDEYELRCDSSSYKDGDNITTKFLYDIVYDVYGAQDSTYEMQLVFISNNPLEKASNPATFTFNIIKQRNTTFTYEIVNSSDQYFVIDIALIDSVYETRLDDEAFTLSGAINATITNSRFIDLYLTYGCYNLTLTYNGTENYKGCTTTIPFTLYKDSQLTIDKDSYDYYAGIDENITLHIDPANETGDIKIYVKEGDEYVLRCDGFGYKDGDNITTKFIYDMLKEIYGAQDSTYQIQIVTLFDKESIKASQPVEFTFNIIKQRNTTIKYEILNNIETKAQINISVIDPIYNTTIEDAQIILTGDVEMTTTNGVINLTTLTPGNYTINANYAETEDYKASSQTIEVEIIPKETILKIITEDTNFTADTNITLKASVTTNLDETINGGKVVFKINGKTVKDANGRVIYAKVTDGTAQINYNIPASYAGKTLNISAVYSGYREYDSQRNSTMVTVEEKTPEETPTPTLTITPITEEVKINSTITLEAQITADNQPLAEGKVAFKINGKTLKDANGKIIYAKVDENGKASMEYTLTNYKAKNYTITATYINTKYEKLTDTTEIKVVK